MRRQPATSFALLTLLALCQFPAQAQFGQLSERDEIELGRHAAAQVERKYPLVRNAAVQDYVNRLGQQLARNSGRQIRYHFRVLDLPEVNAFALPGGYIYINRGALELAENESELAGVRAHETAHVAERHSVEQIQKAESLGFGLGLLDLILGGRGTVATLTNLGAQLVGQGVFMKFSRDAEREADQEGVRIMQRAGIHPRGMLTFFQRMEQTRRSDPNKVAGFFSSHPSLSERERNVGHLIATLPAGGRTDSAEFRQVQRQLGQYRS